MNSAKWFFGAATAAFAIVLFGISLTCPPALAQQLTYYQLKGINVNPIVNELDGRATFAGEWDSAAWTPHILPSLGTLYGELKWDWMATASNPQNTKTYNGFTLFLLDDITDLQTQDLWDFDTFELIFLGTRITAWVFGNGNMPDNQDYTWIGGSGLNYQTIDDRGFLVRLNNDPTTYRQWLPGGPEPGDLAWIWNDYWGFFGSYGFNNSAWERNLPNAQNDSNEVYEVAFHDPQLLDSCKVSLVHICNPGVGNWFVDRVCYKVPPTIRKPIVALNAQENVLPGIFTPSFAFPNPTDSIQSYMATASSERGWPVNPDTFNVTIPPQSCTTITLSVTVPNVSPGTPDTITVRNPEYFNVVYYEVSGPPHHSILVPNSITVEVGDTIYMTDHLYDAGNRYLKSNPTSYMITPSNLSAITLLTYPHVPDEYAQFQIVGLSPGSGTITIHEGPIVETAPLTVTSPIPNLNITLTPINPPIIIPANGGSFNLNVSVQRTQAPQAPFYAWACDRYPNGTYSGNLLGPVLINPPVGVLVQRQRTQVIPGSWPAGVNYYIGYAHSSVSYPATDADSFSWIKSSVADGGQFVWQAANYGEPFPGEEMGSYQTSAFSLNQCKPNPFNATTAISYELRAASYVNLKVYDTSGRLVITLVDGWREAGPHQFTFDGSNLSTGIYLLKMQVGDFTAVQKLVLLK